MIINRFLVSLIGISLVIPAIFGIRSEAAPSHLTRGEQADAERWMVMGENYLNPQLAAAPNTELGKVWDADGARWTSMGAANADQRGWITDAARWTALGEAYAGSDQRGWEADAARWKASGINK